MRKALLLFNPSSGERQAERVRIIGAIESALRCKELDVCSVATDGPGTAGCQAAEACGNGFDFVFACGGDGTIHEVLQGMAFEPHAALGIIPLGSANALARHLGLPLDPLRAALQQLRFEPRVLPIGKVTYASKCGEASRYFIVMAGAGSDGMLVYKMLATGKHRFGRVMYYTRSAQLFLSTQFSPFSVTSGNQTSKAVSAMAVRVSDLGGFFSPLIRGASVEDAQLLLTTVSAPASLSLLSWFALSWARLHRWNRFVTTQHTDSFTCGQGKASSIQVQADGEWLGRTPMTVTLMPDGIRLLMPPTSR